MTSRGRRWRQVLEEGRWQAPAVLPVQGRRRVPDCPATRRLAPVGQLGAQSLAIVGVGHERLAVAMLARALAHVLQAGTVVHRRVHLAVAGLEDRGAQPITEPADLGSCVISWFIEGRVLCGEKFLLTYEQREVMEGLEQLSIGVRTTGDCFAGDIPGQLRSIFHPELKYCAGHFF